MLSSTWSGKKKLFITAVLAAIVWAASSSPWFRAPQATEIYYVDQGTKAVASLEPAPFQPVESNKKAWAAPDSIAVNKEEVASPSPDQLVLNQSATTTDLNKLEDSAGLNRQILRYLAEQGQGVNFEIVHGQEAVWEMPRLPPIGVVIFGHGCYHSGGDLWAPQPNCPTRCIGLPEEITWRRAMLARGYVVIGISSQDRVGKGCWFEVKTDRGASAAKVARAIIRQIGVKGLPVYAMGVSGGASMAMNLPQAMPEIVGVYAQVRALKPREYRLPNGRVYPPIVFMHMATRDPENADMVEKSIDFLTARGTIAAEIRTEPQALTVEFLTARSHGEVDIEMAIKIVDTLKEHGYLDSENILVRNMRSVTKRWAPLLAPFIGNITLVLDKSSLGELINVAYARHEFVHDNVDAVMEWLESGGEGGQKRLDELVEREQRIDNEVAEAWRREVISKLKFM